MSTRPTTLRAKKWVVAPAVPPDIQAQFSDIHPILLQVLYNRGFTNKAEVQGFLEGRYLESVDPFLLADMDKAVARIQQAIENDEKIAVFGDFDADGVTSTVLLTEALRGLSVPRANIRPYIPDRIKEGYGLNKEALTELRETHAVDLVISVDCGIRSVAEVEHANAIGLDVIITDHHSLGPVVPPATAVLNPKRPDSEYPEKMLAGVGIAYKLAEALHQSMPQFSTLDLSRLLDLVAIGTVADLAPLLGENRKLVIEGLEVMNMLQRPGVASLAGIARVQAGQISAETIGFMFGPRINAAGRLSHAYSAAKLLAAPDRQSAGQFATDLEQLNRDRQKHTEELGQFAETLINTEDDLLMASDEKFLPGVVGLVASRLTDKYYRPSIILEKGPDQSRGSCRSIPEFHITNALDEVAHLLVRHGGHAQAAGFTIDNENLDLFHQAMLAMAKSELDGRDLKPAINIDAVVALSDIDWALYENLAQLEPTGQENRPPVLMSSNVQVITHRVVGKQGTHLQIEVSDGQRGIKGIAFRQGDWADQLPRFIDITYSLSVNEWRGRRDLQLLIKDIRYSEREAV